MLRTAPVFGDPDFVSTEAPILPLRTEEDHRTALREIERLWDAAPGTNEHDRLDVLATLVDVYEREHHPIEPPEPIAAILFRTKQRGAA